MEPLTPAVVEVRKVLVTGDRRLSIEVDAYLEWIEMLYPARKYLLVHGEAKGADLKTAEAARRRGWSILGSTAERPLGGFPADWSTHGKAAGPIRNASMVAEKPDLVLGFLQRDSVGTRNCLSQVAREFRLGRAPQLLRTFLVTTEEAKTYTPEEMLRSPHFK